MDSVMLLQPDISPGYDLSAAMAHVDRHLFYTTSILDFGTLGFWTRILGTMDGVSRRAGFAGFRALPAQMPPRTRASNASGTSPT